MVFDTKLASGWAMRLRHSGTEIQCCRQLPIPENRFREFFVMQMRLGQQLDDACKAGVLPEIITMALETFRQKSPDPLLDFEVCKSVVGFYDPTLSLKPLHQFSDDVDGPEYDVCLKPGFLSLMWPTVFEPIYCGFTDNVGDANRMAKEVRRKELFAIAGYYSTACELLAEWIESQADDDNDNRVQPGDGVNVFEKTFTWGGVRFERLTPGMIRVLQLLVEGRRKGASSVSLEAIRKIAKVGVEGGMKSQVFKLKRKGWPPVHPVSDLVIDLDGGFYSLIDPEKVPGKVPISS